MKFALLALVGAINAAEVVIPTIEWNQAKVETIGETVKEYGIQHNADKQADNKKLIYDLSMAYSKYRVWEYVSFSKNFKPLIEDDLEFINDLTVTGVCNREIATQCVTDFFMQKTTQGEMETCVYTKAGCTSKWSAMTPAEQQTLADKYMTDVMTMGKAYHIKQMEFVANLKKAWAAHEAREAVMKEKFFATCEKVAFEFGCNTTCLKSCMKEDSDCFSKCECGKGVVKVTPQRVNTLAIIKDTYGDLHNLSDDDVTTINEHLALF